MSGPGGGQTRIITVPASRLPRWVAGFGERHAGGVRGWPIPNGLRLTAADGAVVLAHPVLLAEGEPDGGRAPAGTREPWGGAGAGEPEDRALVGEALDGAVLALVEDAACHGGLGVLLVRRGGYAVAVLRDGRVEASKVGTRYVQGRTAAGGWSQHRFARRRDNQTAELLGTARDVAVRLLVPVTAGLRLLVTGGDRHLVDTVLAEPVLARLTRLPRGPHVPVRDPRLAVVTSLPATLASVRLHLTS